MNKRLRNLFAEMEKKQGEVRSYLDKGETEKAKEAMTEVRSLKDKIEIEKELEEDEEEDPEGEEEGEGSKEKRNLKKVNGKEKVEVRNVVAKAIVGLKMSEAEERSLNSMVDEDGKVLTNKDISKEILELQETKFDIRHYLDMEDTALSEGDRPYEKEKPKREGFASFEQDEEIQEMHDPKFDKADYAVIDFGGFLPITKKLKKDSAVNIFNYVKQWAKRLVRNTYNYQVFNGTGTKEIKGLMNISEIKRIEFSGTAVQLATFKTVINKDLEDYDTEEIKIYTNPEGYNFLDTWEDKQGRFYVKKNDKLKSRKEFLDSELVKVPSKFLSNVKIGEEESVVEYVPFLIGDLKSAFTVKNSDKGMRFESTDIGGSAWRKDNTEVKACIGFGTLKGEYGAVKILLIPVDKLKH